jgi:DNA-binding transcriptional ArsR family regulator
MELDYPLDDVLELTKPEQFKALGDAFRQKVLGVLMERAATTTQLAEALNCPTSTMAHHLNVLTEAGLTKIVKTRRVRAITERYYGRTAKLYIGVSSATDSQENLGQQILRQRLQEITGMPRDEDVVSSMFSYARIPADQAQAFAEKLTQLAREFSAMRVPGEHVYGFLAVIYRTTLPELPPTAQD